MMFAEIEIGVWAYVIAFCVVFMAQIYGAVASGDGLIIQPVLIGLGIPANVAMANDTTGSIFNSVTAGWIFHKNGLIPWGVVRWWLPGTIIGPVIGAYSLANIPVSILEWMVIATAISGAIYFLFFRKKNLAAIQEHHYEFSKKKSVFSGFLVGFLTGLGLGGVGIVTRLCLMISGLDIKRALAGGHIVGCIPIIPACATYIATGLISPMFLGIISIAFVTGSWVGAHLVIKMDAALLEKLFMISTVLISIILVAMKL